MNCPIQIPKQYTFLLNQLMKIPPDKSTGDPLGVKKKEKQRRECHSVLGGIISVLV